MTFGEFFWIIFWIVIILFIFIPHVFSAVSDFTGGVHRRLYHKNERRYKNNMKDMNDD